MLQPTTRTVYVLTTVELDTLLATHYGIETENVWPRTTDRLMTGVTGALDAYDTALWNRRPGVAGEDVQLAALVRDGHLPPGDYLLRVDW